MTYFHLVAADASIKELFCVNDDYSLMLFNTKEEAEKLISENRTLVEELASADAIEVKKDSIVIQSVEVERVEAENGEDTFLINAKDLKVGMRIDLEGDEFADPEGGNTILQNEYAEVAAVDIETENCVCIYAHNITVGFPVEHKIKLNAHIRN